MRIEHEILSLPTAHPFVIARGGSIEWRTVWVRVIDDDGAEGWGEAAPSRFYGETADGAVAALKHLAPVLEDLDPWSLEEAETRMNRAMRFNGSVKSAISAALHDLAAKRLGVPLWRMWGLDPATAPLSSFTIAIAASQEELERKVAEIEGGALRPRTRLRRSITGRNEVRRRARAIVGGHGGS